MSDLKLIGQEPTLGMIAAVTPAFKAQGGTMPSPATIWRAMFDAAPYRGGAKGREARALVSNFERAVINYVQYCTHPGDQAIAGERKDEAKAELLDALSTPPASGEGIEERAREVIDLRARIEAITRKWPERDYSNKGLVLIELALLRKIEAYLGMEDVRLTYALRHNAPTAGAASMYAENGEYGGREVNDELDAIGAESNLTGCRHPAEHQGRCGYSKSTPPQGPAAQAEYVIDDAYSFARAGWLASDRRQEAVNALVELLERHRLAGRDEAFRVAVQMLNDAHPEAARYLYDRVAEVGRRL